MKKIEKLFKKINKRDRERLLVLTEKLISKNTERLNIKKITDSDLYRLRSGKFRIIFHHEKEKIIIDSIKLRTEKTYRNI